MIHLKTYLRSYNFPGLVVGVLFVLASFLPSLLPRGWVLQGVLSGILFSIGYAVGLAISFVIRELKIPELHQEVKTPVRQYTLGLAAVCYVVFLALGDRWQKQAHQLVGRPPEEHVSLLGIVLITLVTVVLIMLVARSIASLYRWLRRLVWRIMAPRLAYALAAALTAVIVVGLVNGVIFNTAREALNQAFGTKNGSSEPGVTKPTGPALSGSPQSYIAWHTLGLQGRSFVSAGQDVSALSSYNHAPAVQPVRIYAGLESAGTTVDRATLAVKDLERAGGFRRPVLAVITTTGTGWVDERGMEGLEYMYNGNTAMVAMQYSYLPSWLSFLVDKSKAQDAGIELYNAVLARWQQLPPDARPKLVVFGESLGSFGSESAFTGWSAFRATANGAVWTGPPNFNHLWRPTTSQRDGGSPEILPVVHKDATVRFATKSQDFTTLPLAQWPEPRAVYLQNASDPIVWWSPRLLFHKPDWLNEPRGSDVSPVTRWLPVVTFWQVTGDMVFSTGVPDNHGHTYGTMPTEAWSYVAPPPGWTAAKTAELRTFLAKQPL